MFSHFTVYVKMSRLVNESNNNNTNYRNIFRKTADFMKGIETLDVKRVEAALKHGYRPSAKTANRAYSEIRMQQRKSPFNSRITKKVAAMYSVLIKYKLEPEGVQSSHCSTFVLSYVTGSIRLPSATPDYDDYLELPTPLIRKMLTEWRVFIRCHDSFISHMVYETIGMGGRTGRFRPNHIQVVKMLFDMCKTHGRTLIRTGTKMRPVSTEMVKLLLANLPRDVLREDVDFRYSLNAISQKQARIEYIRTLRSMGIDLRQVILETRYPDELGVILDRIGNEYAKSGELYEYVALGRPQMTKFLLSRGMDPNSTRQDLDRILAGDRLRTTRSPLRIAIEEGRDKDIRLFKKKGIAVTPELRRYLETHVDPDSPTYKLLTPPVRQRKVSLVKSFSTVDPVAMTPVPLNQAMIYPGNTHKVDKVHWIFHPNTVSELRNANHRHPMTRRQLNHSKARKLMPLLRKADHKRYHDKYAQDVAQNQ